ncbi:MAG: pseudouridine synthase [Anaerolineae bacterium]
MESERLQKILARAGYGSRRACEDMIEAGRVTVDGKIASLGDKADPDKERIEVDGVPIAKPQPRIYMMLHKPRGYITTTQDPHGRRTVMDLVPTLKSNRGDDVRLYPVGRLDFDSEGLLLLTNDGWLTQRLTHPSYGYSRVYRVLVKGEPDAATLERWQRGITLDGRPSRFDKVVVEAQERGETWLRVTIHEGRNHLVRRIVAALGHPAQRLIRVAMGPLKLGGLPSGKWRYLTDEEVRSLRQELRQASRSRSPRSSSRSRRRRR